VFSHVLNDNFVLLLELGLEELSDFDVQVDRVHFLKIAYFQNYFVLHEVCPDLELVLVFGHEFVHEL